MKWRHWAILIVLVLLNYIIFSTAFTQLAAQRRPEVRVTRTPLPTFENVQPTSMSWVVMPTHTPVPTRVPVTPAPTGIFSATLEASSALSPTVTTAGLAADTQPAATVIPVAANTAVPPTATPLPPTAASAADAVYHTIQRGETLSQIAQGYGVTVQSIVTANGLTNPNHIITGQTLLIPAPGQVPPTSAPGASPAKTPKPKAPAPAPTPKPPAPTPAPAGQPQFTAEIIWHPLVAPNCDGPGISKQSIIRDASGSPVNGVRVELNCYDNIWLSHPSGNPGEYDPGHYDFSLGQYVPQDWTCTARVVELNGQPVTSSEVVSIHFDTNNCKPDGNGHQIAIVNWTKHR
jgi:LysM repeat protein